MSRSCLHGEINFKRYIYLQIPPRTSFVGISGVGKDEAVPAVGPAQADLKGSPVQAVLSQHSCPQLSCPRSPD